MGANITRHLRIKCGPYGILLDIDCVIEIIKLSENNGDLAKKASKNSNGFFLWNDEDLPFFDLYHSLGINLQDFPDPKYVIVLAENSTNTPITAIAAEDVYEIIDTELNKWHEMKGINDRLDILFDMAYPHEKTDQILMRLNPKINWLS